MFVPSYTSQNIKEVVENICEIMTVQAIHKSVNLVFSLQFFGENEQYMIDKDRVSQVIVNLISNAIKFSAKDQSVMVNLKIKTLVENQ